MTEARRALGVALVVLTLLPLYELLDPAETGTAGAQTLDHVRTSASLMWSVLLLAAIPFVLGLRAGGARALVARMGALIARLERVPVRSFALAIAAIGTAASIAFGLFVLEGKPNLVDAMAQLVHARYLADGMAAGPTELAEFHVFPNTLLTPRGWVSHYPPGFVAMLALGMLAGVPWLVGPVLLGATLFFSALIAERALPHRRAATRLALALAAISPFLIAHAGAYMNHVGAAAFSAASIWCMLRAREGSAGWAVAAGFTASVALATRPLSALVMIGAAGLLLWGPALRHDRRAFGRRLGAAVAGALPVTLGLFAHNAWFFGSPLTFGYQADPYGPSHALGFGRDPWGNRYGLVEAVGYTSSELSLLSVALFETPLPLVAIAGLYLIVARALSEGERLVAAWAIAPVAAGFFYWHHGVFMGPRMLYEAAPAWILLVAVALDELRRRVPVEARAGGRVYTPRAALALALAAVAIGSVLFMAPRRLLSFGGEHLASLRVDAPAAPEPALVFVHGPWTTRIGSRLAAAGMRLDSLETALRQNATCTLDRYATARENGDAPLPALDMQPRADRALPRVEVSPDNFIRVRPGEPLDERCLREIRADEHGVHELAPLLWQATLPGQAGGVVFVRDMGPERNRALLRRAAGRTPFVLASAAPEEPARLMPYEQAMALLWESDGATALASAETTPRR